MPERDHTHEHRDFPTATPHATTPEKGDKPMRRRPLLIATILALVLVATCGVASSASATGDANAAACGNESFAGFTAFLPDCRVFERVSSAFLDGWEAEGFVISPDGSHALETTGGVHAGVETGSGQAGLYEYVRSGSGWRVAAVSPPSARFPFENFKAASADLTRTLWFAREPGESQKAKNAYVREPDGTVLEVGPLVPPEDATEGPAGEYQQFNANHLQYVDASSNLSHVFFMTEVTEGAFWPGDTTFPGIDAGSQKSLYEYVGLGNTSPRLVGVSDGSTVVNGVVLPAGRLISDCETTIGAIPGDVAGAVSADGETVFFTAEGLNGPNNATCGEEDAKQDPGLVAPPVNELYARIGASRTVAISEPTAAQCTMCVTPPTEAAGRRGAEFQGASEDGSKVLFLTEQQLFAGDSTMNLYEYDFAGPEGSKVLRVSSGSPEPNVQGVLRISADGSHVYFVAQGVLTGNQENGNHEAAELGADNLYVFERDGAHPEGKLAFIGRLSSNDHEDWDNGNQRRHAQVTHDGRYLVFESSADLVPGDRSAVAQAFEYDAQTGELVRVSRGEAGEPAAEANADAYGGSILALALKQFVMPTSPLASVEISADGSAVLFSSEGALTRGASSAFEAGSASFYVYRSSGTIAHGAVSLLAGARGNGRSAGILGLDPSGEDVFFTSGAPLAGASPNSGETVFDARIDGGFPLVASPAGCAGQSCHGAPPGGPAFAGAPSESTAAGGNVPAPAAAGVAPPVKAPSAASTRAARLRAALAACRRGRRRARAACEARARAGYGPVGHTGKRKRGRR